MKHQYRTNAIFICTSAVIAALYTVFTLLSAAFGLSGGVIQFRISEAFCILGVFTPAAIPGVTLGCLISNLITGGAAWDVVFGTVASLAGMYGVYLLRKLPLLAPLPYFAANTLAVPFILRFVYGSEGSLGFFFLTVGIGELVCAWAGGIALYFTIKKTNLAKVINKRS